MKMKSRTRTILEIVAIVIVAVWIAFLVQWKTRHPEQALGPGAYRDALR